MGSPAPCVVQAVYDPHKIAAQRGKPKFATDRYIVKRWNKKPELVHIKNGNETAVQAAVRKAAASRGERACGRAEWPSNSRVCKEGCVHSRHVDGIIHFLGSTGSARTRPCFHAALLKVVSECACANACSAPAPPSPLPPPTPPRTPLSPAAQA